MEYSSHHDDVDGDVTEEREDVIPSPRPLRQRRASLTGEPSDLDLLAQWQEETLLPLKEDLSDWLCKTLDIDITVDTFLETLDTGVHLCQLAAIIHEKAQQCHRADPTLQGELPRNAPKCKPHARSATWFARDNIANFVTWCRHMRVKEECMFETEGLAMHREPRSVVLCLLDVARVGYKYGLEPPSLIKMEKEIEREEQLETGSVTSSSDRSTSSSPRLTPVRPLSASKIPRRRSLSSKSDDLENALFRAVAVYTHSTGSYCACDRPQGRKVRRVELKCKCPDCFTIERLSEGKYSVGGRILFVRLLKGRHVMVRVGGGWDTLEHYLATHDPCKVNEYNRSGAQVSRAGPRGARAGHVNNNNNQSEATSRFLFMQSRYTGPCKRTGKSPVTS